MIEKDNCGMFQLYFYINLFNSLEDSAIIENEKSIKKIIQMLLNEITTNKEENENRIENFTQENNIERSWFVFLYFCILN